MLTPDAWTIQSYAKGKLLLLMQGAFDAGAYSFFGDMAPLDEGLGGALEVCYEAGHNADGRNTCVLLRCWPHDGGPLLRLLASVDWLCCQLQDGLEAPPEEFPAHGDLEDDEDLPIEALMDDEDEDLSLAALLRRQMLMKNSYQEASSSSKV